MTKLYGENFTSILSNNSEEIHVLNEATATEQSQIHYYSIMIFVSTAAALIKTYVLLSYCRRASINIHKSMLGSILAAPMAFFDTHFIGNILNRFSQDMNNIDELLPFVFTEVFRVSANCSYEYSTAAFSDVWCTFALCKIYICRFQLEYAYLTQIHRLFLFC